MPLSSITDIFFNLHLKVVKTDLNFGITTVLSKQLHGKVWLGRELVGNAGTKLTITIVSALLTVKVPLKFWLIISSDCFFW